MPGNFREIRRRIKGVKSTKQITKTMEMVSASRMRRAQNAALQIRAYAEKALEILNSVAGKTGTVSHPLLETREAKNTLVVLVTSDRGLCGGLNTNTINNVLKNVKGFSKESVSFITIGKKGRDAMMRMGYKVVADFSGLKKFEFQDIWPVISMVLNDYTSKKTDRVYLAYPNFINTLVQKPAFRLLLPLSEENLLVILHELAGAKAATERKRAYEYKFEPGASQVLEGLLPRFTEMQVFKAVLESQASEHSARMAAMKNATDAAEEIIDDLTFTYNQVRQAGITSEIAEISTAAEALK
ncbi:MAG: ATP synthase F1 subunit gamma [Patescibacteria group bacterium]